MNMPEQPPKFYDRIFATSKRYRLRPENSEYFELWSRVVPWLSGRRVLDLGCGPGQFAQLCLAAGVDYHGVDFSAQAIKMAGTATGRPDLFAVADVKNCATDGYDCFVILETLEHVADDLCCLGRIPCGSLVVLSVPSGGLGRAHVHPFLSMQDVLARYSAVLTVDTSLEVSRPKTAAVNGVWFLVKGVRQQFHTSPTT